jgi:AbiJ N-terminal domain 4
MLTDIFANRYANVPIWPRFGESERRLVLQGFRLLSEQICPYYEQGRETARGKAFWSDLHSLLSMELGLKSLSQSGYSYNTNWMGKTHTVTGSWTMLQVCENWMLQPCTDSNSADRFIKERLSLVEIGFRKRGDEIGQENARLPQEVVKSRARGTRKLQGPDTDPAAWLIKSNEKINKVFRDAVDELNTRFIQANCPLNYHNGFIQISTDRLTLQQVERPFWDVVVDPQWANVDVDMKEALDRRDGGSRDPAFYAARALESAIKIISGRKGWTHGKERGAHNYIENLASPKAQFIAVWEGDLLKAFFSNVRNPLGHGPGEGELVSLTDQQTNWAIEFCMSWIKSLIRRM